MVSLADLPFVEIKVTRPHGEPWTWSDVALIEYIDEYTRQISTGGELFAFNEGTGTYMAAWIELYARTEPS